MKKLIWHLNEMIKKERNKLWFIIIIFLIGVILGSLFINFITDSDKSLLIGQVNDYLLSVKKLSKDVFGFDAFLSYLLNNILQLIIIFVLGISMIGVFIVIFIMFFKGFMLGSTLSVMILKYKLKGILGCFLYVFPVMILNILIYVFLSFFALYASSKFIKAFLKKDNLNFKTFLGKYFLAFVISIILIILTSLLDAYLTPLLTKLFTYLI